MTCAIAQFDSGRNLADQIAERLDEAACTLAALPSNGLRPADARVAWPDIVPHWVDLEWPMESDDRPPRPTSADIRRMDEALAWVSLLDRREMHLRHVVNMRLIVHPISQMHRYNWRQIGMRLGKSDNTAKRWHRQACEVIGKKIAHDAFSASHLSVFARNSPP